MIKSKLNNYFAVTLSLLFCLTVFPVHAYRYLPTVSSFDKKEYNAGRQNWAVEIDKQGIVYFGNNAGLLRNIFGVWELTPTASNDIIRSVFIQNDTIWTGGSQDFGYFVKDGAKGLVYTRLGSPTGGSVWSIEKRGSKVYFQTEGLIHIFDVNTKKLVELNVGDGFYSMAQWRDKIWAINRDGKLGVFNNDEFVPQITAYAETDVEVRTLFVHKNLLHYMLIDGRLFVYDGNQIIEKERPEGMIDKACFSAISYSNNAYCLGTISDGFIMIDDAESKIKSKVDSDNKLIDNTVLALAKDKHGNVWLGLDYGIAYVELQNVIRPIFDRGATYCIENFNDETFIAANKGMFVSNANKNFELVPGSEGQVWKVKREGDKLFICHNIGLLEYDNGKVNTLFSEDGVLAVARFNQTNKYLIATYTQVFIGEKEANQIVNLKAVNIGAVLKLSYDEVDHCIWATLPGVSVHRICLNTKGEVTVKKLDKMVNYFETEQLTIFYNGESLFERINGVFELVNKVPLNTVKGPGISALDLDRNANLVAYIQKGIPDMIVNLHDGTFHSYRELLRPLEKSIVKNHEFIDLHNGELRVATDRGVVTFNPELGISHINVGAPIITKLVVSEDNNYLEQFTFPFNEDQLKLTKGEKDIQLHYGISRSSGDNVEFRYMLWPYDSDWSSWERGTFSKTYTKLKGDEYSFRLECRLNGKILDQKTLAFEIRKYWYQTELIFLVYTLVFILCIVVTILVMMRITKNRINKEKQHNDQNVIKNTITIKNEQLLQYAEIIGKKNEFLIQVKDGLSRMRNNDAKHWERKIMDEVGNEKRNFFFHKLFSELHQDFISRLTEKHPNLTPHDVRIVSFIRINLGTHEIANLMNISPKSVDINRYRIRKKMELAHETDLNIYIREM